MNETNKDLLSIEPKSNNSDFEIIVQTNEEARFAEGAYRYGDGGARILDIKLLNLKHRVTEIVNYKEDFYIQVAVLFEQKVSTFCFGYLIKDIKGIDIVGTTTSVEKLEMPAVEAGEIYIFEVKATNILNEGVYTITLGLEIPVIFNQQHIYLDAIENAVVFKICPPTHPQDKFWSKVYASADIQYIKLIPQTVK